MTMLGKHYRVSTHSKDDHLNVKVSIADFWRGCLSERLKGFVGLAISENSAVYRYVEYVSTCDNPTSGSVIFDITGVNNVGVVALQ